MAKRIGSILISGYIFDAPFNVLWHDPEITHRDVLVPSVPRTQSRLKHGLVATDAVAALACRAVTTIADIT